MGNREQWEKLAALSAELGVPAPVVPADGEGEAPAAGERPEVELLGMGRGLGEFAAELGGLLAGKGLFRGPAGQVVEIDEGAMRAMSAKRFRSWVEMHVWVYKWAVGKGKEGPVKKEASMNNEAAGGVLESEQFKRELPRLDRVLDVRMPVFREGGGVALLPEGYDEETRTFTMGGVPIVEELPLKDARLHLEELLGLFLWAEDDEPDLWRRRSFAVQLAAMLSIFCRLMLPEGALKPAFLWCANQENTGKSKLAMLVLAVLGRLASTGFEREDKFEEKVNALIQSGNEVLFLDNVRKKISSQTLERLITSPELEGRVLGTKEWFSCPNRVWVCVTANGPDVSRDFGTRVLQVNLFSRQGDSRENAERIPVEREMSAMMIKAPSTRGRIVSALWAIVREWDDAGQPGGLLRMRDFTEWVALIPGMVTTAGAIDPVTRPKETDDASREMVDMHRLVEAMVVEAIGEDWDMEYDFSAVVDLCRREGLFAEIVGASDDEAKEERKGWRTTFGRLLSGKQGSDWRVVISDALVREHEELIEWRWDSLSVCFGTRGEKHRRYRVALQRRAKIEE